MNRQAAASLMAIAILMPLYSLAGAQTGPGMGQGHGMGPGQGMMMHMQDADQDGIISQAEHRAWVEKVFVAMDTNTDGQLTREEYLAVHMGPGRHHGSQDAAPTGMRAQADARKLERFAAMDADGDGVVPRAQFIEQADRTFAGMDANGDGRVGVDEFRAHHHGH